MRVHTQLSLAEHKNENKFHVVLFHTYKADMNMYAHGCSFTHTYHNLLQRVEIKLFMSIKEATEGLELKVLLQEY